MHVRALQRGARVRRAVPARVRAGHRKLRRAAHRVRDRRGAGRPRHDGQCEQLPDLDQLARAVRDDAGLQRSAWPGGRWTNHRQGEWRPRVVRGRAPHLRRTQLTRATFQEITMPKPLLQTTIAGSLPKPAWLAQPNQLWAPWLLDGAALEEAKRDATRLAIRDQELAGIDIVTDGEQSRRHFVTGYLEHLKAIDFKHLATMFIRKRYDAKVPQVVGPVTRTRPVHTGDVRLLRAATSHPIKYTLPGPMTIIDTLADRYYKDRARLAMAFAKILNKEARELAALGADV